MFTSSSILEKAFDKVWRDGLWYKLLLNNMNGYMYHVIVNMYNEITSCNSYNQCKSDIFPCNNDVRQGENVYPFLFSLYLNDLESFLHTCNSNDLKTVSNELEDKLEIFLQLFCNLYAADTVLISESATDLQKHLECFSDYSDS